MEKKSPLLLQEVVLGTLDGNGRIARVMMNAELVKGGQSKIIIPTVFRDDYLGALKKLLYRRTVGCLRPVFGFRSYNRAEVSFV